MIYQEIKRAHVAMVGEAQMADAARLALLEQELKQTIIKETGFDGIYPTPPMLCNK